jgi:hypothetical protein
VMPPENMQLGLRKSASPNHHGMEAMIFVANHCRDCVYAGMYFGWERWHDGCLLLNNLLILVFAMTCPTRMHFFYLKYFQIATSPNTVTANCTWTTVQYVVKRTMHKKMKDGATTSTFPTLILYYEECM